MDQTDLDRFVAAVGTRFLLPDGGQGFPLTLVEAAPLAVSGRAGGGFRLEFTGPAQPLLPQGTYGFAFDGEDVPIFIVPVAQDANTTTYEAIFN